MGAVFVDCKMDLQTVWNVYTRLFPIEEINKVIKAKPMHPVRELMEAYPCAVKFNAANVAKDGIVSIIVEVTINGKGAKETLKFKGLGRNGISAKYASAKCALREFAKREYREAMYVTYTQFLIVT